ncbi:S8 family peptidase [Clostridium sp. E02]|uniref:S8 family peptidase n=1 Tax=Clostridium sp. E02 TaxID=2487134 RepID=UPI000F543502|nr:S8 family peptidase [Clostridium sp. E02]
MNSVDIEKIYSNEYADFFVNFCADTSILEQYEIGSIHVINILYAVAHLPVSIMTDNVISRMGYASIPSLFGLVSQISLEASGIPAIRNNPSLNLRGRGVLIGIVDTGIDYTNPVFQYNDKTTKVARIWDQTIIPKNGQDNVPYGTEYSREQINEALQADDPYRIVPSRDEIGHGTMLAGIAAGNEDFQNGFSGVAPDSELVIVKMKPAKPYLKEFFRIPEDAIAYQETDLIYGIQYLNDYAASRDQPIVLCIAVDTAQYAHDGRGTTSNWLSFISSRPRLGILIAVGNEGIARRHYGGIITEESGHKTVELNVGPDESGFSMELWGTIPNTFFIDITTPSGEYIPTITLRFDETRKFSFIFDPTIIYVDSQLVESQSGDQLILLRFTSPSQGRWKFNVYSRGIFPISFNMWLPMGDFIGPDTFFINSDPNVTLLSLSCAITPISVTAYNTADNSLYINAGRGYTRINVVKPEIAAPGVNILSPSLNQGFVRVTGTSAAVAHAAGAAALMFEWGIVKGNYPKMSTEDLKVFMIRGAKRKADLVYPNYEWGYGILDVFNIFGALIV